MKNLNNYNVLNKVLGVFVFVIFQFSGYSQDISETTWYGILDVGSAKIELQIHRIDSLESRIVLLDSPMQGVKGLPGEVALESDSIRYVFPAIKGELIGVISGKKDSLLGKWKQANLEYDILFTLNPPLSTKITINPSEKTYQEKEITFPSNDPSVQLAGTLTIPNGSGPFPAVVLVSGSGPQDRNSEVFGKKPFEFFAHHLSNNGIIVLRYDDRGVGKSTGDFTSASYPEYFNDITGAVNVLKKLPEADASALGIVGHSEGAILAPEAGLRNPEIDFLIMLAGSGAAGREIITEQMVLISGSSGVPKERIKIMSERNNALFDIVQSDKDSLTKYSYIKSKVEMWAAKDSTITNPEQTTMQLSLQLLTRWFYDFLNYSSVPYLAKTKIPVLALQGELDLQVPPKKAKETIESALKLAGNEFGTVLILPELNHLFQKCKTGSPMEYGTIDEAVNPMVLDLVKNWILSTTNRQ